MKFNLETLQHYLFINQGVPPENVTLETEFRSHLHMSVEDIRKMLGFITEKTGVTFSSDSDYYLTDVFELLIHLMIRSINVEISEEFFAGVADSDKSVGWQEFLNKKFKLPFHAVQLS
ncbi:hypothetical protein [Dyadobacter frigoris]|uniref:Uncharacterized protein n=1 Tax=Dyadobacter frigoris TaxID=2576211 RepID=A0A4U6D637_9BACT|nr:hypothetical protein [Dyadobacter frigoris]TKT92849.1 hypothetical protein FDK13_08645 [Dyadobacter frigoris]GLU54383.1 hypothetical protein Dfri01_38440 [Dyadobacter frigoris]